MKIGNLVKKLGDSDRGQLGLIVEIKTNSLGNTFATVFKCSGEFSIWYANNLEVISESERSCKM